MRTLFALDKDPGEGRSGIDAFLHLDGRQIPFELKTTSKGSVTTVRDFGPAHIKKWEDKHWLIGFFLKGREFYKYGSPSMMKPWISQKSDYIKPDFKLAELAHSKISLDDLYSILGKKQAYEISDARQIQKRQYSMDEYRSRQDLSEGYTPNAMLEILRDRLRYLVKRGSTLNNPHIPENYFKGWTEITSHHSETLRRMVTSYLNEQNQAEKNELT